MPALRAAPAGPRALGGDGQKTRALARDLFDASARHRTELVHTPFYGVRCVTLQTSAPTSSIHANCGPATPRGEAQSALSPKPGFPRWIGIGVTLGRCFPSEFRALHSRMRVRFAF